jgi:tight adherence protein B
MPGVLDLNADATLMIALIAGACVLAIGILLALAVAGSGGDRRMKRRLEVVQRRAGSTSIADSASTLRLAPQDGGGTMLDRIALRWLPRPEALKLRLARTGRSISMGRYLLTMLGTVLVMTVLVSFLAHFGLLPALLCGMVLGVWLPHMVVGRMGRKRLDAFTNIFPEAIDLIVRALRSGLPISEAIVTVGQEMADPVGAEFRRVEGGMRLGRGLDDILWEMTKRIDTPEFRFFVVSLSVQRETGGNLGETLANLSDILRRRRQMRLKIRAMSSEARASALILGSLPFIVILLIQLTTPAYLTALYSDVRGVMVSGLGLFMIATGAMIMSKMIKFEI